MLSFTDVKVGYGNRTVLERMSINFPENKICSIIGPNGSGKSTLLKAAIGIIPCTPGFISIANIPLGDMNHRERARLVAYLPQSRPLPDLHALTLIQHGRFPHMGFSKTLSPLDNEKVEKAILLTDTGSLLHRKLPSLSGGELQRVYLAMAISQDAKLLLLDEPASHLELRYQLELFEILVKLKEAGKTIIFVSHDLPQAFTFADSVCVIHNGNILIHNSPDEVLRQGQLPGVFGYSLGITDEQSDSLYHYQIRMV